MARELSILFPCVDDDRLIVPMWVEMNGVYTAQSQLQSQKASVARFGPAGDLAVSFQQALEDSVVESVKEVARVETAPKSGESSQTGTKGGKPAKDKARRKATYVFFNVFYIIIILVLIIGTFY